MYVTCPSDIISVQNPSLQRIKMEREHDFWLSCMVTSFNVRLVRGFFLSNQLRKNSDEAFVAFLA
jgi:hypothetical protein